ncbi:DsbA family oxidoreductase [Rheinheimera sediminis]|uniref:DsbA family oxidoreductase n=1 Tax=Rheinheimera sp. YQF-1 TaxID=2499626 RepID=UPI000FD933D0|nr:DsbA family oxidoreductase [Rheinheimera sp. YQF-1]RVT43049.1 DsbA family oxidoreductase [Rheinheimera sp. YQF-1]
MKNLHIDLVSDIACPWCAIGYARLEQAMHSIKDQVSVSLQWRAFELNPDPNLIPEAILPALSKKYGRSEEEMRASQQSMMQIAADLGLNFEKMQQRFTCNTFDAHRLVKWAAAFDKQTAMKQALFEAYFGFAEDVSKIEVLQQCAEKAGLKPEEALKVLESAQFIDEVKTEEAQYQQAGISSVPAFVINQRYLISGAQDAATLARSLLQIADEMTTG